MRDEENTMSQPTIDNSPLLQRIQSALDGNSFEQCILRVSVAEEPKWEKSPHGDEVLVRWLCWSINDGEREIVPPEFEVVGKDVTSQRLADDLPSIFKDIEIIVDSDIDV